MRLSRRERDTVRAATRELGWAPCEFRFAVTFSDRLIGMIGSSVSSGSLGCPRFGVPAVYVFPQCRSVHTCFMPYPIDVAFISRAGEVLALHEAVMPWKVIGCANAWAALERVSSAELPHASVGTPPRPGGRAQMSLETERAYFDGPARFPFSGESLARS